ncbi:uncharacterized protein LOC111354847 isoform X2 [Spodoptera litura]|uniref:Uncharacterized protein LOC111354847 isoform X2 n=1 Tax=Spodoptera litura TaxID=69820 RepID=A0A9J7IR36_SPOLT|nr:uncharacterized protein LOC111354847 isoform X2 [Spodoptera litura]
MMSSDNVKGISRTFGSPNNRKVIKYLEDQDINTAISLIETVIWDHPIFAPFDFRSDERSMESLRNFIEAYLEKKLMFGCYCKKTNELIGVDVLYILNGGVNNNNYDRESGEAFCKYIQELNFVRSILSPVDGSGNHTECLTSLGMFILPAHRGTNIPEFMLKVRLGLDVDDAGWTTNSRTEKIVHSLNVSAATVGASAEPARARLWQGFEF